MSRRFILALFLAALMVSFGAVALAGKVELTTYYPAPYGEYRELKATGQTADNGDIALEAKGNMGTGLVVTNANRIGIGTTTPAATLQIGGSADVIRRPLHVEGDAEQGFHTAVFVNKTSRQCVGIGGQSTYGAIQSAHADSGAYTPLALNKWGGNVGIGTSDPSDLLTLHKETAWVTTFLSNNVASARLGVEPSTPHGNAFLELKAYGSGLAKTPYIDFHNDNLSGNDYDVRIVLTGDNVLDVQGGSLDYTSDSRIKLDQTVIPYGLSEVMKLRPKKYMHADFRNNPETGELEVDKSNPYPDIGLVAQEVYEVVPEAAFKPEDEKKTGWSLGYDKLTPVLIKAVQEQQEEIEQQQEQIDALRQEIEALKSAMGAKP